MRRGRALKSRCIVSLGLVQSGNVVEAWDVDRIRQGWSKTGDVMSLIPGVERKPVFLGGGFLFRSPLIIQRSLEYLLLLPLRQLVLGEMQRHWLSSSGTTVNRCLYLHGGGRREEGGGI